MTDREDRWLAGPIDAQLHLLDRQIIDCEGRMVGKVDDVELTETGDPGAVSLAVTGLLLGAAALVPRLGGGLGSWALEKYRQLGIVRAHRTVPGRIDVDDVASLGSALELRVDREGLVGVAQRETGAGRHRMDHLIGMRVVGTERDAGRVIDVRLQPADFGQARRFTVAGLVVGHQRPGTLLGYDRSPAQGPWIVATAVRLLHRDAGLVPAGQVKAVDWSAGVVRAAGEVAPLSHAWEED